MPSRMIRGDDLRESERFMTQPADVQMMWVLIVTVCCDFGLFLATPTYLRRTLYFKPPSDSVIERRLKALADADLVRIYECDGVRFGFVPRFQQRMDKYSSRHPMPPPRLFSDDEHAKEKFSKYKHKFKKMAPDGGESAPIGGERRPEVEVKGCEVEVKGSEVEVKGTRETGAIPPSGNPVDPVDIERSAKELGIERTKGEHWGPFSQRVLNAKTSNGGAHRG